MASDLFSLEGRTALVTGGSRGIGAMIAKGFVEQGATVYISSRKAEACEAAALALGPRAFALPGDVSSVAGVRALAAAYLARSPALDILVNNAGTGWAAPFEDFPEAGWDKLMDLHLKAPFFLTQALHGALKAAARPDRPAKVINIASIDAIRPGGSDGFSYQASKAGLIYLTRRLAATLIADAINVTAIAPGHFASNLNRDARDRPEDVARRIPARRVGRDEDMAAAAIYLASRAGDYVVGETIAVDGGVALASLPAVGAAG